MLGDRKSLLVNEKFDVIEAIKFLYYAIMVICVSEGGNFFSYLGEFASRAEGKGWNHPGEKSFFPELRTILYMLRVWKVRFPSAKRGESS